MNYYNRSDFIFLFRDDSFKLIDGKTKDDRLKSLSLYNFYSIYVQTLVVAGL